MNDASGARRARKGGGLTALERHAAFFDRDGDGLVAPRETLAALRDLGVEAPLGAVLTALIHLPLGPITQARPALQIRITSVHRAKRGLSSGAFDAEGNVAPAALARLRAGPFDNVTLPELRALIAAAPGARPRHAVERFFSWLETRALFCLAADAVRHEGGRATPALSLRRLRRFYDGSLFHALARRRRLARAVPR